MAGPGGQGGLSFVGEPMMFAVVAAVAICVLLGVVGCEDILPQKERTAIDDWYESCEQAWLDTYDRDPETEPANPRILDDPTCQAHTAMEVARRQAETQQSVERAAEDDGW